jgi:DNA-binding ferritin-like protein (Dps family)
MLDFIKKLVGDKKEYRKMMARVKALPEDYRFVYEKIQKYMWKLAEGDGLDILKVQYDLIDLFEEGVAEGKNVLEVTGADVAAFSDELLLHARTYTKNWRQELNREIADKLGKRDAFK